MKLTRHHWIILGSLALLATLVVSAFSCGGEKDLEFTLTFKDAENLEPGQHVKYKGIRIGEVTGIQLKDDGLIYVGVRVVPEHREKVYREAKFVIERPGWTDISGEKQLTMKEGGDQRTPIEPGDVLKGSEGFFGDALEDLKGMWSTGKNTVQHYAQEFSESEEGHALLVKLDEYSTQAEVLGREKYQQFRQEHLPQLKAQAAALRERLMEEGNGQKAREFWQAFLEWAEGEETTP